MFVNHKLLIKSVILAFSLVLLASCGGGSGGGSPAPNNPDSPTVPSNPPANPPEKPVTGLGFDSATSNVLFVALPDEDSDSTMVLMKDAGGERVVFVLQDGTVVEAEQDDGGRLGTLWLGDHEFIFTDYTETTVTVTYHAPGGAVVSEVVELATGDTATTVAARPGLMKLMAKPTVAEYLDEVTEDTLAWLQDPSNSFLPLVILRTAGEAVADTYESARKRLKSALESASEMAAVVKNKLTCAITPDACAVQVAEKIPTVVQELKSLDPSGQTTAGLTVTTEGIQPAREQWESETGLDFTTVDVPCDESVFADMNPDCPQYVPPTTDPGDPGGEEPLSVSDVILHTAVNTALTGELAASGATLYQLQSQPAHGSVTVDTTGGFTYTPETGYVGVDGFTFVASNGDQTSRVATVTIEVGDMVREAINSTISTAMDTPVSSSFQHVGATYFKVVQQPQNGALTALDLTAGTFTYTPNAGFTGTDKIHFVAAGSSGDSEPAIVTINVGSSNTDCAHSIRDDGVSMYRCPGYTEYWWGDMKSGGFTREEGAALGKFGNYWYVQIENSEVITYHVEHNVYENGQLVRIETYHLSVGGMHNTHHEMDHRVDVRTYEGSTRTSTTRTVIDCSDYEVRRRVYEGQFSYIPVEDETFDTREICPTVEDAQALAGSIMENTDMTTSYVTSSPAYTLKTQAP